ncbi:MAG: Gldg family protein [Xanthobacteraceae bacterium]|nr:Gldg family protein [Xanthobacteraceae bacterium]
MFFFGWLVAAILLFALALLLPSRLARSKVRGAVLSTLIVVGAVAVTAAGNVAIFRHDAHLDLSRDAANSPPSQLQSVLAGLNTEVSLFYFYNSSDANAYRAKELLTAAGRENRLFHFRAIDVDRDPAEARSFGVRDYNTSIVLAAGRRVVVENNTDLVAIAFAILRALKERVDVVCFITGHGEAVDVGSPQFRYNHLENLENHDKVGSSDVLEGAADGLDRFSLALTALGYQVRAITVAPSVSPDCKALVDIGPRQEYARGEAQLIADYLAKGGRFLVGLDPAFRLGDELGTLLKTAGLSSDPVTVIDPLNHAGPDDTKVAVPYYPPHPITRKIALTIFPDARPLRIANPLPGGINASVIAESSMESYQRSASQTSPATSDQPIGRGPAVLAAALEGHWPDGANENNEAFRLVLVGNANFASNAYFPYVSNGDLAVGIVRWLAEDAARPVATTQTYAQREIILTQNQIRAIFLSVELLLPLSVLGFGGLVWWRRR